MEMAGQSVASFHINGGRSIIARIRENSLLRIDGRMEKLTLLCGSGTVCITQAGDYLDHILRPCETFYPDKKGLLIVWAFADAEVLIASY